ncbi:ABC transporter permease [Xenophilus sp. Marseille-Q4582]|uniref:ABC transporter permease n=1 Tax=Xenophilus sp. Marseille-Q4582 TaxID=2866600 RepID=UPI001CE4AB1C|nr:ABC transporter permease [Xenophilus sp. Marseille-Q4582]
MTARTSDTLAPPAASQADIAGRRKSLLSRRAGSVLLLLALLALWEFGTRVFNVPKFLLPPFSDVVTALYRGLAASPMAKDGLWLHTYVTLTEILLGFAIGSAIGLVMGVLISEFEVLDDLLRPYIAAFQSLPKVAIAPIVVTWLGFGLTSKVAIVCLITFFPVLVTSIAGFKAVDIDRIDLMRSLSATRWQIFIKVKFPGALPYIFAGLDMAAAFSVVGAIVGEFVGAQAGLGVQILQMEAQLDTAGSFAVFIVLSLLGIALTALLRAIRQRMLSWMPATDSQGAVST